VLVCTQERPYQATGKDDYGGTTVQAYGSPMATPEEAVFAYLRTFAKLPDAVIDRAGKVVWKGHHRHREDKR